MRQTILRVIFVLTIAAHALSCGNKSETDVSTPSPFDVCETFCKKAMSLPCNHSLTKGNCFQECFDTSFFLDDDWTVCVSQLEAVITSCSFYCVSSSSPPGLLNYRSVRVSESDCPSESRAWTECRHSIPLCWICDKETEDSDISTTCSIQRCKYCQLSGVYCYAL